MILKKLENVPSKPYGQGAQKKVVIGAADGAAPAPRGPRAPPGDRAKSRGFPPFLCCGNAGGVYPMPCRHARGEPGAARRRAAARRAPGPGAPGSGGEALPPFPLQAGRLQP